MSRVQVALCGLGRIGQVHLRHLLANPRIRLLGVVDVDELALKKVKEETGIEVFTSLEEVLSKFTIQGVIVCTPTATHASYIKTALAKKAHVFCEKPVSLDIKEVDECYEIAKLQNVHLLCGFQRRSDPNFARLHDQVTKHKAIGNVQIIKTTSRDHPVPAVSFLKLSGGFFHDCASHDLDIVRWIAGENPIEVFTYASTFRTEIKELNDVDTAVILLKFASGILASIDLSRKAVYGYDQRIEVHGDGGMIKAENTKKHTVHLYTDNGELSAPGPWSFQDRYPVAYAEELDHFVDIIEGKAQPKITHDDVKKVTIIANAVEESFKTGKPVRFLWD
eukprot:TRINITY_DN2367_c0_g1_i2.p1 TRINITY_DN2367_c0_g1~~TRINITY_DN2367_c0_g1_i2.p1  ORF type:complete len:335 (-),score=50.00 TRINITY_DN2367_c0_g1_i2:68-1072(-)